MEPATAQTGLLVINAALAVFVLGLAYAAGKHITRIDHLEDWKHELITSINEWRKEQKQETDQLFKELRALHDLIVMSEES